MKNDEVKFLSMRTRAFGGVIQNLNVPVQDVPRRRKAGWVAHNEQVPEPQPPDIEVLTLKVKDAIAIAEKAEANATLERHRVAEATTFLELAKESIPREAEIKRQAAIEAEQVAIRRKCFAALQASSEPLPFKRLLSLAASPSQEIYVRNYFGTQDHQVGIAEDGDRLIMLNKVPYLREKAEREQREAAEKEVAIRARMNMETN
ncbi:MAG: hypothetical protein IPG22_20395 [Acidobacteria bacterium]|nr:hypothetical protein [Acidobacteriota bacterium]